MIIALQNSLKKISHKLATRMSHEYRPQSSPGIIATGIFGITANITDANISVAGTAAGTAERKCVETIFLLFNVGLSNSMMAPHIHNCCSNGPGDQD